MRGKKQPDYFDLPSATIVQSCLRLFGHVCRQHDNLPTPPLGHLLFWEPVEFGKRKRGGNRRSLADYYLQLLPPGIRQDLIARSDNPEQKRITMKPEHQQRILEIAADRKEWKKMVSEAKETENQVWFAQAQ